MYLFQASGQPVTNKTGMSSVTQYPSWGKGGGVANLKLFVQGFFFIKDAFYRLLREHSSKAVQWNPSKPNTLRTKEKVRLRGVFSLEE